MDVKQELSYKEIGLIRIALENEIKRCKDFFPEASSLPEYEIVLEKIEDILLKY